MTFPFKRQPFSGETLHKATEWDTNTRYFQVEKVYRGFSIMRYLHNNEIFNLTPSQGSVFENNRWKIITEVKEIS